MNLTLPDVASGNKAHTSAPLKWVGMEKISTPINVPMSAEQSVRVNAMSDVFVSLDKADAKGIHMSRLYIRIRDQLSSAQLSGKTLKTLLLDLAESQQGLSQSARVRLEFELMLNKSALLSDQFGYQSYPVVLDTQLVDNAMHTTLELVIPYSSTCPCSAALSRQALSEKIAQEFAEQSIDKASLLEWIESENGSVATPHSQRSYATLKLTLGNEELPNLADLIAHFEKVIGTAVQTAVKRQDEQAFAQLNAQNLMFCEDAARRLKEALEQMAWVSDYWFKVDHQESLHAHNAVAIDQKYN